MSTDNSANDNDDDDGNNSDDGDDNNNDGNGNSDGLRPYTPLPSPEGCGRVSSFLVDGYKREDTKGDPGSGRPKTNMTFIMFVVPNLLSSPFTDI